MVFGLQDNHTTAASEMFDPETVTLTRTQLKAILEAVGKVGGLRLNDDTSKPQTHLASSSSDQSYYPSQDNIHYVQQNNLQDENLNGYLSVQPDPGISGSQLSLSSSQHAPVSSSSISPVSRLQQKRQQWERERVESEVWNPWGRPGAGAPRNTRKSIVMATVSPTPVGESLKNHSRGYSGYSCATADSLPISTASGQRVPDFIKSSIPFGPNAGSEDLDDNLEKKRQWLADLEQQREDQRRRRRESRDNFDSDHWGFEIPEDIHQMATAGRYSGATSPVSTITGTSRSHHRGQSSLHLDPETASRLQEQRERALDYQRSIQQQVEEKQRKKEEERQRLKREEELEEQRLEEERESIRLQYEKEQRQIQEKENREEQKRLSMAAAVQKAKEEAEADKRAKKAQRMSTTNTPKSPKATPSERVQPSSRLAVREELGHNLRKSPETLQRSNNSSASTSPKHIEKASREPQQTATAMVHPIQSSSNPTAATTNVKEQAFHQTDFVSLGISTVQEMSAQTDQPVKLPHEPSAYVANRILTPSVLRTRERRVAAQNAWGHHRDMATQTDTSSGPWDDDDRSVFAGSERAASSMYDQSSRNSSATSSKRGSTKSQSANRPVWGVNQPVKTFVKMTDRDPNHSRRKKFQEMRRQHWEREMTSLREQLAQARSRSRANVVQSTSTATGTSTSTVGQVGVSPRLNRARVSSDSGFQVRRRAASEDQAGKRSERDDSAWSSAGSSLYALSANSLGTTYTMSSGDSHLPTLSRRWSHSHEQLPPNGSVSNAGQSTHSEDFERGEFMGSDEQDVQYLPPVRRKWHSQESFPDTQQPQPRPQSPVDNLEGNAGASKHSTDEPSLHPPPPPPRRKWSEQGNFDPAAVALGRQTGIDSDSEKGTPDPAERVHEADPSQDPLVNPKMVTSRPTPRQDRILQQLSTLRQGLLQKQREIESLVRQPPSTWTS